MTETRMGAERLARIDSFLRGSWLLQDGESALTYARELRRELDAVTRERDALQSQLDEFISARANGRSANDD